MSPAVVLGWAAIAKFFGRPERTVRRWPSMGWLPCIRKNPIGREVWALREDLELIKAAIDAGDPMPANRLTQETLAKALGLKI